MKLAAVHAIADLAKQPVPDVVNEAYHVNNFTFGPDYFIPKPVDPRLITEVSMACLLYTSHDQCNLHINII